MHYFHEPHWFYSLRRRGRLYSAMAAHQRQIQSCTKSGQWGTLGMSQARKSIIWTPARTHINEWKRTLSRGNVVAADGNYSHCFLHSQCTDDVLELNAQLMLMALAVEVSRNRISAVEGEIRKIGRARFATLSLLIGCRYSFELHAPGRRSLVQEGNLRSSSWSALAMKFYCDISVGALSPPEQCTPNE